MRIEIEKDGRFGYRVYVNDELILECVSEDDIKTAKISDLMSFAIDGGIEIDL